jgi:hypothetical protein
MKMVVVVEVEVWNELVGEALSIHRQPALPEKPQADI